jgi:hypothetical protein
LEEGKSGTKEDQGGDEKIIIRWEYENDGLIFSKIMSPVNLVQLEHVRFKKKQRDRRKRTKNENEEWEWRMKNENEEWEWKDEGWRKKGNKWTLNFLMSFSLVGDCSFAPYSHTFEALFLNYWLVLMNFYEFLWIFMNFNA